MSPRTIDAETGVRSRRRRVRARASIGSERSMPTMDTPAFANGSSTRPVPHPSSSVRPPARRATPRQKATSRRPTVRAFSQS